MAAPFQSFRSEWLIPKMSRAGELFEGYDGTYPTFKEKNAKLVEK